MRSYFTRLSLRRQKGLFDRIAEFERTQFCSEAEIRAYQEVKLRKLISHAYNTVPFYREHFDKAGIKPDSIRSLDDLYKIPVLVKEDVRENYMRLLSTKKDGLVFTRRTGGSTGVPLVISNNFDANLTEQALYYRFLKWMGYEWGARIVKFWGEPVIESRVSRLRSSIRGLVHNTRFMSTFDLNDKRLARILGEIRKNPPTVLRGYASSLHMLAMHAIQAGIRIELNAVTTTAEKLYPFQRKAIQQVFGNRVFDQYGCGEVNSLAFECGRHNGLHIAWEHVILELLDENGKQSGSGHVVITNLDNYAMPLIRYRNEDLATMQERECGCGRRALLKEINGRVSDFIQGPNGNKAHAEFFTHVFGGLRLAQKYLIKEFRVVQKEIDSIRIEFVTSDDLERKDRVMIERKVSEYLGPVRLEIAKVESIPPTRMGKKMFVLSMLNRKYWGN